MENKTITILMATYNGDKYLKEQIDSVLSQKKVNLNILVRDDGSTDKTQEILEFYQNSNKLTWYTGPHLNVAKGFMELIEKAPETDYYAFCDQDDIWLENKLFKAINMLEKEDSKKPLMYYSSTTLVNEKLEVVAEHHIRAGRSDLARFLYNDMSGNTIVFNNVLKNVLKNNNHFDITIHDKWTLQICLAIGGKCIGDDNSYTLYRQHSNNTIGMELSFRDKIRKFFSIINQPNDVHFEYLKLIDTISPYSDIIQKFTNGNGFKNKISIINNKSIIFDDLFFRLAFVIHILKSDL